MKIFNLLLISLLIAFSSCAKSQKDGYTMFYNHYNDMDGVVSFKIAGAFASMFFDADDEDAHVFMDKMDKVSFLIADKASKEMVFDLNKSLTKTRYKTIMEIRDGGSEIQFFAREDGTIISEILMTVIDDDILITNRKPKNRVQ